MIDSISDNGGGGEDLRRSRRQKRPAMDPAKMDRLPPHSLEAEQGVLGCVLWLPSVLEDMGGDVRAEDFFYDLRHKTIFDAAVALYEAKKPVDLITVQQKLKDAGRLDEVGGIPFLSSLQDAVPSAANVSYYRDIVFEKWLARRQIQIYADAVARLYDHGEENDVQRVLEDTEREVLALGNRVVKSGAVHAKELVRLVIDRIEERFKRGSQWREGPQTGLRYLDNIIPGFAPGQMVVIAGRPGDGKSCLAMQIAEHVSIVEKTGVYYASLEMTDISLMERQMFSLGNANLTKMRNGFLVQEDVPRLTRAGAKLANANLWVESTARMAIEDFEVKARRMVRKHGVKLLIVDYLQLLFLRNRGRKERVEEMGEISMRIKALAMELGVPIIVCAQMNRNIETSEKKRKPVLSDLRECGQIEQDADIVLFLWRPKISESAMDDAKSDEMKWLGRLEGVPAEWRSCEYDGPEIIWTKHFRRMNAFIAKQREGRSDVDASLVFVRDWCRFLDPYQNAKEDELPPTQCPPTLPTEGGPVEGEDAEQQ